MIHVPGTLTVVAVGKLRTPHWLAAQTDYLERLQRYLTVQLVEVRDVVGTGVPDHVAIQQEGEQLLEAASAAHHSIALDEKGKHATSVGFSRYLQRRLEIHGRLAFLIGGPVGLSDEALEKSDERLALSMMTLPHELARVLLLEQIYRAMTILSGQSYHK
jgi:23S rRNA (pseudouridine1915-N3)-methyltransferase